ncbi:MAG: Crp/Fnr family transcriptional regulator [Chloroflexi bacterium]|nr:Crp/Fnr family transcriptional regulator [Chloroflexota bacterium]
MTLVDYFKSAKEFVEYSAGQTIFEEGKTGDLMFAVKEGLVEIIHDGHVLETVEAGHFFGEMALVDSMPRSAGAVAKTDCKIVAVDKKRFLFLVQETPTFALQVMHTMAERLRKMNQLL